MRKSKIHLSIFLVSVLLMILSVPYWLNRDWWYRRVGHAKIYHRSKEVVGARAYRSPDGKILLILPNNESYIILSEQPRIFSVNPKTFILTPGWAYSKEACLGVPLDGTQEKMDDFNARPVVNAHSVEFSSFLGGRIRVEW